MIIAVASGKGGTGKTTIATSLVSTIAESGKKVSFLDCDVEAPNAHLFFQPDYDQQKNVDLLIPKVDKDKCSGCGRCGDVCEFHAIVVLGGNPLVFPNLCHGCGSCTLVCPEKAITETPEVLGVLESGSVVNNIHFARGTLNVGEPMASPIIRQLKQWENQHQTEITIIDSPPGTSCPVVESIRGTDFVILVTESTPFGLHDLKLAAQLVDDLHIPAGVIINREGIGDAQAEKFCHEANLPILMRIPFERVIGEGIARGELLTDIKPELKDKFIKMYTNIMKSVKAREVSL
jgi:MinD superfamily P-loop ATPase